LSLIGDHVISDKEQPFLSREVKQAGAAACVQQANIVACYLLLCGTALKL